MANAEYITGLDAVDLALGGVIAKAYTGLANDGSKAFKRFLTRPDREKIMRSKNDDIQATLRRIARNEMEPDKKSLDLPLIIYYRDMSLTADQAQQVQVIEAKRYVKTPEEGVNKMEIMRVTAIPVTLTYSMLFLAWDRATIERMALAWWGYIAPRYREHSRFEVRYMLDGELVEVPANLNSPREVLTSSEPTDESTGRLWGSRTMIEVNTQALYTAKEEMPETLQIDGIARNTIEPRLLREDFA